MPQREHKLRYDSSPKGRATGAAYRKNNRLMFALSTASWRARKSGYAPVDPTTVRPKPLDGLCELCRKSRPLCIDHDHKTGRFRGWLCQSCNRALGTFGDTVEGLQRALAYLIAAL